MVRCADLLQTMLIRAQGIEAIVNGPKDDSRRLPNTLSISIKGVQSGALLASIKAQVAASAGSACHTGGGLSKVLQAMDIPAGYAAGTLRLSVGRHTTENDVLRAAEVITNAVRKQLG